MPVIQAWIPTIHDEPFLLYYARRMSDFAIAHRMQTDGLKVTSAMVTQRRRQLDLPANRNPAPMERVQDGPPPKFRPDPLAAAHNRVEGFDRDTMTLNGRSIPTNEIIRMLNAILKAEGKPQFDANKDWLV